MTKLKEGLEESWRLSRPTMVANIEDSSRSIARLKHKPRIHSVKDPWIEWSFREDESNYNGKSEQHVVTCKDSKVILGWSHADNCLSHQLVSLNAPERWCSKMGMDRKRCVLSIVEDVWMFVIQACCQGLEVETQQQVETMHIPRVLRGWIWL